MFEDCKSVQSGSTPDRASKKDNKINEAKRPPHAGSSLLTPDVSKGRRLPLDTASDDGLLGQMLSELVGTPVSGVTHL